MMSLDTAKNIIDKSLDFARGGQVTYAFQGGEPTLRGLAFYKDFAFYVKQNNKKKVKINYAIQTNGVLIDENWAGFFHENSFLVGLSLDGTKETNDMNRITPSGEGSFKRIIAAADIFKKSNVDCNVLSVVTKANAKKIIKIYNYFKKNKFRYLQFIPCLEPLGENFGYSNYSLTVDDYEMFLKNLFDLWYKDIKNGDFVSIRYFDNVLSMFMGYEPESCDMRGICSIQNVVEADGSVYPCDFYVMDEYKLGNINQHDIHEFHSNYVAQEFVEQSIEWSHNCKDCNWISLCRGGCRRYRGFEGKNHRNYYCKAFYNFYEYSYHRFIELVQMIRFGQFKDHWC